MAESDLDAPLSRTAASAAVAGIGWRYLLGELAVSVPVRSLAQGSAVATAAIAAAGADADGHLRVDLRPDRVELSVADRSAGGVTTRDTALADRVGAAVAGLGLTPAASVTAESPRPVQALELAIDAIDIPAIQPFWMAIMGYQDEVLPAGPEDPLVDAFGQWPSIWFQQMDAPRPQRNRIHFDICVPHDEAQRRIAAALAAGGRLRYDAEAPAFWVLADPEGNEACITTWQGRDPA